MAARRLSQQGGEVRGRGTHGSARAHLDSEARYGAEGHVTTQRLSKRGEARGHRTPGSARAHLDSEARSRAVGHMAAPEPTSTGTFDVLS
jgi:hypothetical protein